MPSFRSRLALACAKSQFGLSAYLRDLRLGRRGKRRFGRHIGALLSCAAAAVLVLKGCQQFAFLQCARAEHRTSDRRTERGAIAPAQWRQSRIGVDVFGDRSLLGCSACTVTCGSGSALFLQRAAVSWAAPGHTRGCSAYPSLAILDAVRYTFSVIVGSHRSGLHRSRLTAFP